MLRNYLDSHELYRYILVKYVLDLPVSFPSYQPTNFREYHKTATIFFITNNGRLVYVYINCLSTDGQVQKRREEEKP